MSASRNSVIRADAWAKDASGAGAAGCIFRPPDAARTLFWTASGCIPVGRIVARAGALADQLPEGQAALILHEKRDYFVVALLAAWMKGAVAVLPSGSRAQDLKALIVRMPDLFCLSESPPENDLDIPLVVGEPNTGIFQAGRMPALPVDAPAVRIFTSGSTGSPVANEKSWALLSSSVNPTARMIDLARLDSPSIVATVPSQHMYGFELSVLQVLQGGMTVHVDRPAYPADIARCLEHVPEPRVLVTTPFHLRGIVESQCAFPSLECVISATAPMSTDFAKAVERRLGTAVREIYGFTEGGSVATRRTAHEACWTMRDDLSALHDGERPAVQWKATGDRVDFPDVLEILDATRIRLLGRNQDMVKIAGKRGSLAALTEQLTRIRGVEDGALTLQSEDEGKGLVSRLVAVVVAPTVSAAQIREELRQFVDPVFLPRYIVHVTSLPRNETGKLRQDDLQQLIADRSRRNGHV